MGYSTYIFALSSGMILQPGQAYTEVIQDEVHLSMATMESRGCIGTVIKMILKLS